jgi:hypothetical protein
MQPGHICFYRFFSKNSAIGETLIEGSGGTFAARPVMA